MNANNSERDPSLHAATNGSSTKLADDGTRMELPWWSVLSKVDSSQKQGIGSHVAGHFIRFGTTIQVGPGTTPLAALVSTIEQHKARKEPLAMVVLTTSLQIYGVGRQAQYEHPELFSGLHIVLTGGYVNPVMQSLVGDYATQGVCTPSTRPELVLLGVYGISFDEGLRITYHFPDEVTTQAAYARRPTSKRLIVCSHVKIGVKSGCTAEISVESLLEQTTECIIVTTFPGDHARLPVFTEQVTAFEKLTKTWAKHKRYENKNFALRMVTDDGEVAWEFSFEAVRTGKNQSFETFLRSRKQLHSRPPSRSTELRPASR